MVDGYWGIIRLSEWVWFDNDVIFFLLQQPEESFGMNVAGGVGGQVGDLPIYISAIRPESAVAKCGKIQVSLWEEEREGEGI